MKYYWQFCEQCCVQFASSSTLLTILYEIWQYCEYYSILYMYVKICEYLPILHIKLHRSGLQMKGLFQVFSHVTGIFILARPRPVRPGRGPEGTRQTAAAARTAGEMLKRLRPSKNPTISTLLAPASCPNSMQCDRRRVADGFVGYGPGLPVPSLPLPVRPGDIEPMARLPSHGGHG